MTRTDKLRSIIGPILSAIDDVEAVYYERASAGALYPHIVYTLQSPSVTYKSRKDMIVDIDIWDKDAESAVTVETICDSIEDALNEANLPNDNLLPTFFVESRMRIEDEDKTIRHRNMKVSVQFYERN